VVHCEGPQIANDTTKYGARGMPVRDYSVQYLKDIWHPEIKMSFCRTAAKATTFL
jgi:hypothetical protein